ncbi:hypothetical protein BDZ97DRAFT_1765593 [Flammula alnicola]|nr:hypothetical protein BDZ97DRAFT_1765593 [Flammula alnicola]
MSSALHALLQPVWDVLRCKLISFTVTPEVRHISAASMALSQPAAQMATYMHGLETTGSPEPVACMHIHRWLRFLVHIAGEAPPSFSLVDLFDPTNAGNFYPLHVEAISEAEMDTPQHVPYFDGLVQWLLAVDWVRSPSVGPLIAFLPLSTPLLAPLPDRDLGAINLLLLLPPASPPMSEISETPFEGPSLEADDTPVPSLPSLTENAEGRLYSLLQPPPHCSRGRKGKARAYTPAPASVPLSPLRALLTHAAAAHRAAATHPEAPSDATSKPLEALDTDPSVRVDRAAAAQLVDVHHQTALPGITSSSQVTLDVEPTVLQPLKHKVAMQGNARSKRPRLETTATSPELETTPTSKLLAEQFVLLLGQDTERPATCSAT